MKNTINFQFLLLITFLSSCVMDKKLSEEKKFEGVEDNSFKEQKSFEQELVESCQPGSVCSEKVSLEVTDSPSECLSKVRFSFTDKLGNNCVLNISKTGLGQFSRVFTPVGKLVGLSFCKESGEHDLEMVSCPLIESTDSEPSSPLVTAINGTCGLSHGQVLNLAPSSELCSSGKASFVKTNSNSYSWSCMGLEGGSSMSCSSTREMISQLEVESPQPRPQPLPQVSGVCGSIHGQVLSSIPSSGLCSSGDASPVSKSSSFYFWNCMGSNGGSSVSCRSTIEAVSRPESELRPQPQPLPQVSGVCGSAHGQTLSSVPSSGLCSSGNASSVVENSNSYSWSCRGVNGGSSVSCRSNIELMSQLRPELSGLSCSRDGDPLSYIEGDVRCKGDSQVRCEKGKWTKIYSCRLKRAICHERSTRASNGNFFTSCKDRYHFQNGKDLKKRGIMKDKNGQILQDYGYYKGSYYIASDGSPAYKDYVFESCYSNAHLDSSTNQCVSNYRSCSIKGLPDGRQVWNTGTKSWQVCEVVSKSCTERGYVYNQMILDPNKRCVPREKSCYVKPIIPSNKFYYPVHSTVVDLAVETWSQPHQSYLNCAVKQCKKGWSLKNATYGGKKIKYCEADVNNPSPSKSLSQIYAYVNGEKSTRGVFGNGIKISIHGFNNHQCELSYRAQGRTYVYKKRIDTYRSGFSRKTVKNSSSGDKVFEFKLDCYPGRSKSSKMAVTIFDWTPGDQFHGGSNETFGNGATIKYTKKRGSNTIDITYP